MNEQTQTECPPRTHEEVIAFYLENKEHDLLGTMASELLSRLPFEKVKPFLANPENEKWEQGPRDRDSIVIEMREYMDFAWGKATGHRGISASRSIDHYRAWLWLIQGEQLLEGLGYAQYGAPMLKAICEQYGLRMPEGYDKEAAENMARGEPCCRGCEEGCGA